MNLLVTFWNFITIRDLGRLLALFCVILAIFHFFQRTKPIQASMESSDYYKEKRANSKRSSTEFRSVEDENYLEGIVLGDLIEFQRYYGIYEHWGVYVGGGYVVHLIPNGQDGTEILKETLKKVATGKVGKGIFRVNNLESFAKERGLIHRKKKTADIALRKFEEFQKLVRDGKPKPIEYDLMTSNCEHFATSCAYGGEGFSVQAANAETKDKINYLGNYLSVSINVISEGE